MKHFFIRLLLSRENETYQTHTLTIEHELNEESFVSMFRKFQETNDENL